MIEEIKVHVVKRKDQKNLFMRYKDPMTGRQVSKSTGTNRRKDALKVAGDWESQLREGRYKSASKITWKEFRERYEAEYLPSLADTTFSKVCSVFNMIEDILKPDKLIKLTSDRLSYYQNELRKMGRSEQTIKSHIQHLKAALNWAKQMGMLHELPQMKSPHRAKSSKLMKGRPITLEEFERMLSAVKKIVLKPKELADIGEQEAEDHPKVESWKHLLRGLWWSGLRLSEALNLSWDDHTKIKINLSGEYPMMMIPAELEKGNQNRMLTLPPEFAEMVYAVPNNLRTGLFFNPTPKRTGYGLRLSKTQVGRIISDIGEKAGVKVSETKGEPKYASAHDLRRSFGERWSTRVMPQVLMQMMRHETIETTMKFYVGRNAETAARAMYSSVNGNGLRDSGGDLRAINEKRTDAKLT